MKDVKTNDDFFRGLSVAESEEAVAIETEIMGQLQEGLSQRVGMTFVRTVMEIKRAVPNATVEGVFEAAMLTGLPSIRLAAGVVDPKRSGRRMVKKRAVRGT